MSRRFRSNKKLKYLPLWRIATTNCRADERRKGFTMKYLKYIALLALLALPLAYSQAEVRVGVGVGFCAYGYYPDSPYGCAPYGYYGPSWFANGIFIGAGPWYGWGHPYYGRGYYRPRFERLSEGRRLGGRGRMEQRGFEGRGSGGGFRGGSRGRR